MKSITLYQGNQGEEQAKTTFNFNYKITTIKSGTDFEYAQNDTLVKSTTFRNDIATLDVTKSERTAMKSITLYQGNQGEEQAKTTFNFNYTVTTIKSVTDFEYDQNDTLVKSTTFRNDIATLDVTKAERTAMKSITLYQGNQGEEQAKTTFNFNYKVTTIKSVTDFESDQNDPLGKATTFRNDIATLDVRKAERTAMKSITLYQGNQGEEQAKTTFNFNYKVTTIKSVTDFEYDQNDTLVKSTTFRNDIATLDVTKAERTAMKSITLYQGNKGEEQAKTTFNFNYKVTTIKSVTDFEYDQNDTLVKSTTFRTDIATLDVTKAERTAMKSTTLSQGTQGEEHAKTTFNFNYKVTTIKSVTDFEYDQNDTLVKSTTFSNDIATLDVTKAERTAMKSITLYQGNQGEEQAKTTFNFNYKVTTIKSVTDFAYDQNDKLVKSTAFRNDIATLDVTKAERTAMKSITLYQGNQGEEQAKTTFNFNYKVTTIKSVTDFEYDQNDTLVKSTTF